MQAYSDPKREQDPHALPDVEVFYVHENEMEDSENAGTYLESGWYWWSCFPGCLPDSDPMGPFETQQEALEEAQSGCEDFEE